MIEVRGLQPRDLHAYVAFAARAWGPRSRQASPSRLEWLYEHNPLSRGAATDLLVAVDDGAVVGCVHRCRLPWDADGRRLAMASVHDLMVDPEYRRGVGGKLMLAALAGEPAAVLAGSTPAAAAMYDRMRVPRLAPVWQIKVLRPLRAGIAQLRERLGWCGAPHRPNFPAVPVTWDTASRRVRAIGRPEAGDIADAVSLSSGGASRLQWDAPTFSWRFFHEQGPRHLLVLTYHASTPVGRALICFEPRHGTLLARLVEATAADDELATLLKAVERAMRDAGASVATSFTTSETAVAALRRQRWRRRRNMPAAHIFVRSRDPATVPRQLWGSAGDWGFDAGSE